MTKKSLEIDPEEFNDLDDGGEIEEYDECDDTDLLNRGEIGALEHGLRYFVVPFLAAKTEGEAIDFYKRYHTQNALKKETEDSTILKFRSILSAMLKIAILGKQNREISPALTDMIPVVKACILDAFSYERPDVIWNGREGTYKFDANIVGIRKEFGQGVYSWIRDIAEAFHRQPSKDKALESFLTSFGYEVVGLCPNCGIFFSKKRKDQEYCSRNCQVVASNRQRRRLKKI